MKPNSDMTADGCRACGSHDAAIYQSGKEAARRLTVYCKKCGCIMTDTKYPVTRTVTRTVAAAGGVK